MVLMSLFESFEIRKLEFVSKFEFRYSNLTSMGTLI